MKKTKMFMLVLTSAVLALTPVTANAAEAAPSQVTETVIATPTPTPKKPQKKGWVKTKSGIRRYYASPVSRRLARIISISVPREPY